MGFSFDPSALHAPSILHPEVMLVEPDREAAAYNVVQMTPVAPTRWEWYKRGTIAVSVPLFVEFVVLVI